MYDIIIIGGNLSGATAAISAVTKGVKVALIERHKKPFLPAHCGEAIADVTATFLKIDKRKCPRNEINKIKINISSLKEYKINLSKNKIYVIDRNYLENDLLKEAEEKKVNLFLGRRMVKFNPNKMYMWWSEPYAPFGYAWLFPINENLANIGLGIIGGQKVDINSLLQKYINLMTNEKYKTIHTFRACEPMFKQLDKIISNNVIFVGDSARLVNPASGAGIHNAVFSGTLAGLTAANYIK